jgi:uncharacterized protein YlaI
MNVCEECNNERLCFEPEQVEEIKILVNADGNKEDRWLCDDCAKELDFRVCENCYKEWWHDYAISQSEFEYLFMAEADRLYNNFFNTTITNDPGDEEKEQRIRDFMLHCFICDECMERMKDKNIDEII